MSDITKKIYSIESAPEPAMDDVLRPVGGKSEPKIQKEPPEKVPDFVTRQSVTPTLAEPLTETSEVGTRWVMWTGLIFTLIWLLGAGLFFANRVTGPDTELMVTAGLVVILALPAALITVLWVALRQLINITNRNIRLSTAANALVTPDKEVLGRTQTLADGIRAEISKVNGQLADTVTALTGVQTAITRESQALDAAGLQLTSRSEDVGRNLTIQRQALESVSGTFDSKMQSLSAQVENTSKTLEASASTAHDRLISATSSMTEVTNALSKSSEENEKSLNERVTQLGEMSRKVDQTGEALSADLTSSAEQLTTVEAQLVEQSEKLESLNASTQAKIDHLQSTIIAGQEVLKGLEEAASTRSDNVQKLYNDLSEQLKQSEDDTLSAQGRTARMVEGNLAQMRREFGRMETDLQTLQTRLKNLRNTTDELPLNTPSASRLSLRPLDTDFPPVEPPHKQNSLRPTFQMEDIPSKITPTEPLNLGADMQLNDPDEALTNFDPDVLRRPGDIKSTKSGFGRSRNKDKAASGWHWRDMLGGLERPDNETAEAPAPDLSTFPQQAPIINEPDPVIQVDMIDRLTELQLSPAAIVDDGTIIDATQARINTGEVGLANVVADKLADPVAHLRAKMGGDSQLVSDVASFADAFSKQVGATPPTAPALRAVFSSPKGRAYLLCAAALKH